MCKSKNTETSAYGACIAVQQNSTENQEPDSALQGTDEWHGIILHRLVDRLWQFYDWGVKMKTVFEWIVGKSENRLIFHTNHSEEISGKTGVILKL